MSFKRTSGAIREETIIAETSYGNTAHEHFTLRRDTVPLREDDLDDIAFSSSLVSQEYSDARLIDLTSSAHSPSFESTFITVQEVCTPQQEEDLNATDTKSCLIKDSESVDTALANLNLCSQTRLNSLRETAPDGRLNECVRCQQLEKDVKEKDAKLDDLNKRLQDLMHKHKLFVLSNCQLNEENDSLRMENDQLKLELRGLTFTNSQLCSENVEISRQLAPKENHQLVNRGVNIAYPDPCDDVKADGQFSSTFKDSLKEAVVLSHKQQNDVKMLWQRVLSQNRTIKALYAQIQKSNHNRPKTSYSTKLQQHQHQDEETLGRVSKNKSPAPVIEKFRPALRNSVVDDREDDYAYGRARVPVSVTKSNISPQPETHYVIATRPFQVSYKKSENAAQDKLQLNLDPSSKMRINNGIQSANLRPPVLVGAEASTTENTLETAAKTTAFDQLFKEEILWCPLCNVKFSGVGADFRRTFQNHIAECTSSKQHRCPLCFKTFPQSLPIADFERHVDGHFDVQPEDFEVLERTG